MRALLRSAHAAWQALPRPATLVGAASLVLVTVYAYEGHHRFFSERWGALLDDPLTRDAARHLWQFGASFVLLGVLPALLWRFGLRRPLRELGLGLGDWRLGLRIVALGLVVLPVVAFFTAGDPAFQAEYPLSKFAGQSVSAFVLWELAYLFYYVGWEFHFRGFLLQGLAPQLGPLAATLIQAFPSTLLHIGLVPKPQAETLAAVFAAALFAVIALKTRSVLYVLLLHWALGALTDGFCLWRSGAWPT